MFFEQLKLLCAEKGTTPTALVKKVGFSSATVTSWKNGASPKLDMVEQLADALQVPVTAFFGDRRQIEAEAPIFSAEEIELIDVYRKLDKPGQRRLFGKAYELLDSQNGMNTGDEAISPPNIDLVASLSDSRVKK